MCVAVVVVGNLCNLIRHVTPTSLSPPLATSHQPLTNLSPLARTYPRYNLEGKVDRVLDMMGFTQSDALALVGSFSGECGRLNTHTHTQHRTSSSRVKLQAPPAPRARSSPDVPSF